MGCDGLTVVNLELEQAMNGMSLSDLPIATLAYWFVTKDLPLELSIAYGRPSLKPCKGQQL